MNLLVRFVAAFIIGFVVANTIHVRSGDVLSKSEMYLYNGVLILLTGVIWAGNFTGIGE